ncbi:hypothetical protein D3C81_1667350 [compost metagenome]
MGSYIIDGLGRGLGKRIDRSFYPDCNISLSPRFARSKSRVCSITVPFNCDPKVIVKYTEPPVPLGAFQGLLLLWEGRSGHIPRLAVY